MGQQHLHLFQGEKKKKYLRGSWEPPLVGKPRTPGKGTEKYLPDRVEMTIWGDGVRQQGQSPRAGAPPTWAPLQAHLCVPFMS